MKFAKGEGNPSPITPKEFGAIKVANGKVEKQLDENDNGIILFRYIDGSFGGFSTDENVIQVFTSGYTAIEKANTNIDTKVVEF